MAEYLPILAGQRVGLVVNHTALLGSVHLIDTLLSKGVEVGVIFAAEHGYRGEAADGMKIESGRDPQTGIPVISLYGRKRKPSAEDLAQLDRVIFDIQGVGARFYTFTSTMTRVMEACAEQGVPF
ncbi:MAG: DUF1343 domain-containing protein, partial [Saprospiraceae bacterium]|nr:DUF1343 domain-containing protein [Saprospiraceae bacterium]